MKPTFIYPVIASCALLCACSVSDTHLPKADNYRTDDPAVLSLLQDIRSRRSTDELNSVLVLKDGKKVLEYYDVCYGPDFLNICWSASKTFTATAVGFAVQEGLLSLKDRLVDHLRADQLPDSVSDTLAGLTLYDLMIMSSGFSKDPIGQIGSCMPGTTVKNLLSQHFRFAPGQRYKYNSLNTYLLGVALTNVTGQTVADYLKPRLFEPLGIRNYHWDESIEGYSMGGWGLYITSESLAKMGQFFLQKGRWNGVQLLNEEWMTEAMKPQIMQYKGKNVTPEQLESFKTDDKNLGYCYQMWRCQHNAVRLDGAHGQFSIILPDCNAVIVVTGNCKNTMAELGSVWKHILPLVAE